MKQTIAEKEKRRRLRLSIFAFSYEFLNHSFVSDEEFDRLSKEVDLSIETGNEEMDRWFRENFEPCTGMWIQEHPHKERLKEICLDLIKT